MWIEENFSEYEENNYEVLSGVCFFFFIEFCVVFRIFFAVLKVYVGFMELSDKIGAFSCDIMRRDLLSCNARKNRYKSRLT